MLPAVSTFDLSARSRIVFVVERYGGDEAGEPGRRTRALASALADRGHDVTVLTTCMRAPGSTQDDVAPGETSLDGVRVVRFRARRSAMDRWVGSANASRARRAAGRVFPWTGRPGYDRYAEYLDHRGQMFDAALFTGEWRELVEVGMPRVRRAVLAPPPQGGCTRGARDTAALLKASRGIALATAEERVHLQHELGSPLPSSDFVLGACPEPCANCTGRPSAGDLIDGPFLLCVAHDSVATASLVEAFRTFREAHAHTPFEDDQGRELQGSQVRLVFGGDHRHVHAPSDGILSLGDLDDATRGRLVSGAIAIVHPDPSSRLPQALLEAWCAGRPTIARVQSSVLSAVFERAGASYTFESPSTFAACAAALLSRRGPRQSFGARVRQHVGQTFTAAKVAAALEEWIGAARGRTQPVQPLP